jgi:hypothetical protein
MMTHIKYATDVIIVARWRVQIMKLPIKYFFLYSLAASYMLDPNSLAAAGTKPCV